jgi:predicted MFS family arabinose efflux permease
MTTPLDPRDIGIFLTSCGVVGLMTTILIYPRIARRFNALKTLRLAVALFPLIYFAFPFSTFPRLCALQLSFLILLTVFKVIITVFSFQSCLILLTNSVPGRERASINGLNVAVSSISRGLGGLLSGLAFSLGARSGHVVIAYWILAPVSIAGLGLTLCVAKDEQFREE